MKVYIHQVPGRLRIRTAIIKKKPCMAEAVARELEKVTGIHACRVNRHAGSIVIQYDTHCLTGQAVAALCRKHCLLEADKPHKNLDRASSPDKTWHKKTTALAGEVIGQAVFNVLVQQTVERTVFSMVTAVLK